MRRLSSSSEEVRGAWTAWAFRPPINPRLLWITAATRAGTVDCAGNIYSSGMSAGYVYTPDFHAISSKPDSLGQGWSRSRWGRR